VIRWKRWNPGAVKDMVKANLAENMETACKFVEQRARTSLLAIREPEWGAKYRRVIVARRLTYVLSVEGNELVGTVGVRKGEKGQYYGFYIEVGSSTSPAHPYLRPAVFNHANEIVQLLGGQ